MFKCILLQKRFYCLNNFLLDAFLLGYANFALVIFSHFQLQKKIFYLEQVQSSDCGNYSKRQYLHWRYTQYNRTLLPYWLWYEERRAIAFTGPIAVVGLLDGHYNLSTGNNILFLQWSYCQPSLYWTIPSGFNS